MTDNTQNEPVEVTQADYDRAEPFARRCLPSARRELPEAFAKHRLSASSAVVDALREALEWIAANYENGNLNHVDFRVEAKHRADAALANTPKQSAGMVEEIEVLRKLAKEARDAEANCNRVIELLTPEWERFEKRDGSHNSYASRLYADHTSSARTNKRDADALERILAALEGGRS